MRIRILVVLPVLPTLPIASGSLRRTELSRKLSKGHELHLVCWHRAQANNELVRAFWETEMGVKHNPELSSKLQTYQDELEEYRGIFSSISTLPYPDKRQARFWHKVRWWLSMRPRNVLQYRFPTEYREMQYLVQRRIEETKADVVWVGRFPMVEFTLGSRIPVVVDSPDAFSLRERRRAELETSKMLRLERQFNILRWKLFERKILNISAAFVLNNGSDADYLISTGLPTTKIHTITNGVDTDQYFVPDLNIDEESNLLVFTGSFRYDFNLDGIHYFLEHIWPLIRQKKPTSKLILIGPSPPDSLKNYASENVTTLGYVPDIRPYLQKAALVISPLRSGTGMKNKVLVALAMQKAVVCTSISSDGMDMSDGVEVAIADTPTLFAERVLALLDAPLTRQKMGSVGRQKVVAEYSWQSRAEVYEQLFMSVIENSS